jgi:signal transduction histidine kinase
MESGIPVVDSLAALRPLPDVVRGGKPAAPLDHRSWARTWLMTAGVGTAIIALIFVAYELLERAWLLERCDTQEIFRFHVARGVGTSIVIGTWAFFNIRAMRRRYEVAFARTYAELSAAFDERTRALARAQQFSERLFDALRDRLVVVDRHGHVLKTNRVARAAVGAVEPGGMCRMKGADCRRAGCVALRALENGAPVLGDVRTDAAGRIFSIDAYPVLDPETGAEVVLEVARDVTEAKQLEAQLAAQEKLAALGVLAAGIAHDIANPLASISSEIELLETEKDVHGVRRSVAVLQRHLDRISRTLREMTDFARRRGEDREHVSIDEAVEDALRMVRHDPRARRVRFELRVPDGLPRLLLVEDRLVMMLVNLLINGLDAMPNGGSVAVAARHVEDGVVLEVTDTGAGMTPEVRQRALEPLFTTKASGHGTGLGLTVTADSMRAVGGDVEIESEPGQGTTIRLRFPGAVLMPPKEEPCPSAS